MTIQVVASSTNYISALISTGPGTEPWTLTSVYGLANPKLKLDFWDDLMKLCAGYGGPWCFGVILM